MDSLITYSQTHQQLINTLQSSTSSSKIIVPQSSDLLNFSQQQQQQQVMTTKQTDNFNNYMLNNSYNQIIPLQANANDSNNQNKINDFFKILATQNNQHQVTASASSPFPGFTSPSVSNVFQEPIDNNNTNKYETFSDDPNFYNVAAAYNAVSASLVGRLASKYIILLFFYRIKIILKRIFRFYI